MPVSRTGSRLPAADARRVIALALLVFALFAASQVVRYFTQPDVLYPDFYGLWSFARFVQTHAPATIYDDDALAAFQAQLDPGFTGRYPFLYPPTFLILVWPLGQVPYTAARLLWIAVSLAAALAAVAAGARSRVLSVAMAVAPATVVCAIYGQNGLISAALMIGGVRLARRRRPLLAGLLFGALVYKPQLAILIPLALAAAGLWRAFAAAAASAAAFALLATGLFGAAMWPAWITAVRAITAMGGEDRAHFDRLMPTVTAAMHRLGGPPALATLLQAIGGLAAACVVGWCWRHRSHVATDMTLPVATFLATPFAFGYDLPMVAAACLLAVGDWAARRGSFAAADLVIVLLAMMLPATFVSTLTIGAPLGVACLALLLWRLAADGGRDMGQGPVRER